MADTGDPKPGIIEDLILDPAQDSAVDPDDLRAAFTDLLRDVHARLTDIFGDEVSPCPVKMEDEDIDRLRAIGERAIELYDITHRVERREDPSAVLEYSACDGEMRRRAADAQDIEPRGVASRRGSGDPEYVPQDPQSPDL